MQHLIILWVHTFAGDGDEEEGEELAVVAID